jgi:hypothetical protein
MTTDALPAIPNMSASVESPGRMMSVLRARCIARYRLHSISGRPEELESNTVPDSGQPKRISFGYIHGSVRVRQHGGESNREWVDHRDVTFKEGWLSEVYDYLDPFFDFTTPIAMARAIKDSPQASAALRATGGKLEFDLTPILDERPIVAPRPIRDNPQA